MADTYLTADDILNAVDRPIEELDVPEWGGRIRIQGLPYGHAELTAYVNAPVHRPIAPPAKRPQDNRPPADSDEGRLLQAEELLEKAFTQANTQPTEAEKRYRMLTGAVILCALDAEGNRLFGWEHADQLRAKNWTVVASVGTRIIELSNEAAGLTIEEAGKD